MKVESQFSTRKFPIFLLALFCLSSLSCRKLGKEAAKKAIGIVATAIIVVAVEELAAQELVKQLGDAKEDKEPINVVIHNNFNQQIKVDLSSDGSFWEARLIEPKQNVGYTSKNKGLVGAKAGDNYYMLKKSLEYQVIEKHGKFVIEEVKVSK